jgi:ribosomal protein S10
VSATPQFSSTPTDLNSSNSPETTDSSLLGDLRLPRSVQAVYLRPLRKQAEYGVPSCDLQMRSYSVRNLEFFADFAMRAAYYLGLPAYGPVPLPRIVERWTVPRASFVFKKSQENFERKTLRRLIQIKDGNPETVEIWLAFLKKHAYYGIGMKANVWTYEKLGELFSALWRRMSVRANKVADVGKNMDVQLESMKDAVDEKFSHLVLKDKNATAEKVMEFINREDFRAASGTMVPMAENRPKG